MVKKRPSFSEVLHVLPFMTRAELSLIFDVIKELHPNIEIHFETQPFNEEEFEAKCMQRLTDALERLARGRGSHEIRRRQAKGQSV